MKNNKKTPPSDKPKVPLGKPLLLTDEDLDRLSQITPEDIEKVKAEVKKISPTLANLLNAKPMPAKKKRGSHA